MRNNEIGTHNGVFSVDVQRLNSALYVPWKRTQIVVSGEMSCGKTRKREQTQSIVGPRLLRFHLISLLRWTFFLPFDKNSSKRKPIAVIFEQLFRLVWVISLSRDNARQRQPPWTDNSSTRTTLVNVSPSPRHSLWGNHRPSQI